MGYPIGVESSAAIHADASRPKIVLVINNNPNEEPGYYTQMIFAHLKDAGLVWHEVRSVEAIEAFAQTVDNDDDVGLILTSGSRTVVLTQPVDVQLHVTKTTAAMLHFPNAPIVGICYGMQLVAQLYGGTLKEHWETRHRSTEELMTSMHEERHSPSRMLEGLGDQFLQWATNYIFVERVPPHFVATAVDSRGRVMAMEHEREHVYGFQFHPEKIHEDVGKTLVKRIFGLLGQSRRPEKMHSIGSFHHAFATQNCNGSIAELDRSASHGQRLATARREVLKTLHRDHCHNGGITISALEDAVMALSNLAKDGEFIPNSIAAHVSRTGGAESGETLDICSPHDADLRLRSAIHEALGKSKPCSHVSSLGTSETQLSSSAAAAAVEQSSTSQSAEVSQHDFHEAVSAAQTDSGENHVSASSSEWCSLHEADLQLRQTASEIMIAEATKRAPGKMLSAAKRDMLADLKRQCNFDGLVCVRSVTECKAELWALAAADVSVVDA